MSFKEKLFEKLEGGLGESEFALVPKGFQRTGDIIIMNLPIELENKFSLIGEGVLKVFPKVRTVCAKVGGIDGEFRRPQIRVIAGEDNLEVENFENGVWFCYDASKIMFAKGNVSERGRLPKVVKEGEVIVDMFIGIGYFSLPIAKKVRGVKIYGIDKNPDSIFWLKKAILKNKLTNIEVIQGDSKEACERFFVDGLLVDRVLMGYLPPPEEFVPYAVKILKKGGMVHYDALIRTDRVEEDLEGARELFQKSVDSLQSTVYGERKVVIVNPQRVKSYKPRIDHYVVDILIE